LAKKARTVAKVDIDALRRTPAYPYAEAAHYLRLPVSTLRAWCVGQRPRFRSLIKPDGGPREGLSFLNLVEAHVLAAIRRGHQVPLPKVRRSLDYVANQLKIERPLASVEFQTNGVDLFVDHLGDLLNVSREGQVEMQSLMRAYLERVQRDNMGAPIKLYPFTRPVDVSAKAAPTTVAMDPRIAFGRPVLVGTSVPTAVLADRFKAGDTLRDLADDYDTSPETIEEAIRCEFDQRAA
jgi:uncharacterized protein (DUF433 family)